MLLSYRRANRWCKGEILRTVSISFLMISGTYHRLHHSAHLDVYLTSSSLFTIFNDLIDRQPVFPSRVSAPADGWVVRVKTKDLSNFGRMGYHEYLYFFGVVRTVICCIFAFHTLFPVIANRKWQLPVSPHDIIFWFSTWLQRCVNLWCRHWPLNDIPVQLLTIYRGWWHHACLVCAHDPFPRYRWSASC